jgi:pimeloyl-ACP methyl ester carboxylesterase
MKNQTIRISIASIFLLLSMKAYSGELTYPAPCPSSLKISAKDNLICGYVAVPEKHGLKNGKEIKIFFINAKSTSGKPDNDPILYLEGGPGVPASIDIKYLLDEFKGMRKTHDIILIDQRGTGYTQPGLVCNLHSPYFATENQLKSTMQACKQKFERMNIDISAYNTFESAQDIIDIARQLNLKKWNIYGVSYGSTLAIAISQFNPEGLKSIVVDSGTALEQLDVNDVAVTKKAGYKKFFADCEKDVECHKKYPQLESHYIKVVESFPKHPVDPDKLTLTGEMIIMGNSGATSAFRTIRDRNVYAELIEKSYQLLQSHQLDYETFIKLYNIKDDRDARADRGIQSIMTCYDDQGKNILQWQLKRIAEANRKYPYFLTSANYYGGANSMYCQVFGHGDAISALRHNLITQVPVMILYGQNETIPADVSHRLEMSLKNGKLYQIKHEGHAVLYTSYCARLLMEKFINDPGRWPHNNC